MKYVDNVVVYHFCSVITENSAPTRRLLTSSALSNPKRPHGVSINKLPMVGVEPTRVAPDDFESTASTISPHPHFSVLLAAHQKAKELQKQS